MREISICSLKNNTHLQSFCENLQQTIANVDKNVFPITYLLTYNR